jgi:predicted Fe-Mo cluster-binding NifX family protein
MEKYLVASSGDTLDSKVSGRFGHSGYFLIVNPLTMEYEVYSGVTTYEHQSIRRFIAPDIKKIIVGNIGPSMYQETVAYGCKIFLCRNMLVSEAIKKVENGEVQELKNPTLKDSIHSGRKAGTEHEDKEKRRETGIGQGRRHEDDSGRSMGRGKGLDRRGGVSSGGSGGKGKGRGGKGNGKRR